MAHYKHIDTSPRFLAVDLEQQLLPGTFEYAPNHLLEYEMDLSEFDARFKNDATGGDGVSACDVAQSDAVRLLAGHSERACRQRVIFIALSGDNQPHFTTIAGFVSSLSDHIAAVFG
ncbi:MAG: hypothetical protein HY849_02805 [Nitrosomonadales bacterium]|nr:hypothetical protein [Nitrosomonadales bacterium]